MIVKFINASEAAKDKLQHYALRYGWTINSYFHTDNGAYEISIAYDEAIFFTHLEGTWGMYLNVSNVSIYFDEYDIDKIEIW